MCRYQMTGANYRQLAILLAALLLVPAPASAFDTDLFTASSSSTAPNVLIVLDNTSNWSRNDEKFPDGNGGTITQGQAEANAIMSVIQNLTGFINVGLMEFPTGGRNDNGGYIRFAISPMGSSQATGPANQTAFSTQLTTIYNNVTAPSEKVNSGLSYGNLMYDSYNYYAGLAPFASSADVLSTLADSNGYVTNYTLFKSPLSANNNCANNYIVFIGNPPASGPASDTTTNTSALSSLGGDTTELQLQNYTKTTQSLFDNLGYSSSCFSTAPTGMPTDYSSLCPPSSTSPYSSCTYSSTDTTTTFPACSSGSSAYIVTGTTTGSTSTTTTFTSSSCYTSASACTTAYASLCPSQFTGGCSCGSATASLPACFSGTARYQVLGNYTAVIDTPTGTYSTDTQTLNADEWARFMYQKGIPVNGGINAKVTTYTIDVYGVKPDTVQSSLLSNMAKYGGGRYLTATNATAVKAALQNIFSEIQAVNTTFASAALPISATNRTQNDNQVFIGMFRPDQKSSPRWYGNLKQYKFGLVNGATTLVDVNNAAAVSTSSGFINNCAQSLWTTDSGKYWANVSSGGSVTPRIYFTTATTAGLAWATNGDDTNLAQGQCTTNTTGSTYSDLPDGPIVEKGGAAEMLRNSSSRTIKTINSMTGTTLADFNTTNVTSLSSNTTANSNIVNFIRGQDVTGEINGAASTSNRPSIHGDVIHSKPLAVDFGGTNGVNVYYGANDGTYRSVNASTGAENWAFVAPESFATLQRLMDNTPAVQTPTPTPAGSTAAPGTPKDFFFDGSTGIYQNSDSSKVWIYPSMRRGGSMIYAFDESVGTTKPKVLWKAGCNSSGCTDSNLSNIGQTWSTPNVAFLNGYSTTTPVVILGGGYDTCEDQDKNPATTTGFCTSPKGAAVYVLDGSTGAVVKAFTTDRSVAADVALVDINLDGQVDCAYVADTGGNIYRINFTDPTNNFTALSPSNWTIKKVAYTSGSGRKFLFAPALLPYKGQVYVAIGSGDREHPTALSYPYTIPIVNRFYVYLDNPAAASTTAAVNMDGTTFSNYTSSSTNTCTSPNVLPGGTQVGWYMDLTANGTGEQVVTSALITSGLIAFSTNRPLAGTVCSTSLGEARGYLVDLLNGSGAITSSGNASCGGTRSTVFVGGGLPPSPVSGVVVINGVPQQVVIGVAQHDASTSTSISAQKFKPPIKSTRSRLYWRTPTDTH